MRFTHCFTTAIIREKEYVLTFELTIFPTSIKVALFTIWDFVDYYIFNNNLLWAKILTLNHHWLHYHRLKDHSWLANHRLSDNSRLSWHCLNDHTWLTIYRLLHRLWFLYHNRLYLHVWLYLHWLLHNLWLCLSLIGFKGLFFIVFISIFVFLKRVEK